MRNAPRWLNVHGLFYSKVLYLFLIGDVAKMDLSITFYL